MQRNLSLSLNDVVLLNGSRVGVIRYIGNLQNRNGTYVGVEIKMSDGELGNSDGTLDGKRYFHCAKDCGLFQPISAIRRKLTAEILLDKLISLKKRKEFYESENERFNALSDSYIRRYMGIKTQLDELEKAHSELQSEIEFLKTQLIVKERYFVNPDDAFYPTRDSLQSDDPYDLITARRDEELLAYLKDSNGKAIQMNDPVRGYLIHWAVRKHSIECFKVLFDCGADINQADDLGWTPLIYSVIWSDKHICKLICELGGNVDVIDNGCWSPAVYACMEGDSKILKILSENGANLNTFIYNSKQPLHLAAERGHSDCLACLHSFGVSLAPAAQIVRSSKHSLMTVVRKRKCLDLLQTLGYE